MLPERPVARSNPPRPPRRPRPRLYALAALALVVGGIAWLLPGLRDPDNRIFHPRETVRVVDAGTGEPVVGAGVRVMLANDPMFGIPFSRGFEGRTDGRGEVEFTRPDGSDAWTIDVGERIRLPEIVDGVLRERLLPPELPFRFESASGVLYEGVTLPIRRFPVPTVRVHRTPLVTVEVRAGSKDGPPIGDVHLVQAVCRDGQAGGRVLATTDDTGTCRLALPPSGTLSVVASWWWHPSRICGPATAGTLDEEHPHLVLVASPRRAIRFGIAGAPAGTTWRTHCRRVGSLAEAGDTTSTRAHEAIVDPAEPEGRFDAYVDGGDEGGRAIAHDVECPSTQDLVPARGPRIRVILAGNAAQHPHAGYAESLDWFAKRIPAAGTDPSTLTFLSVPKGRWRVVVARAAHDEVGRHETVVDVGDDVTQVEMDVSHD